MPAYLDRRDGATWRYRKRVTLPDGRRIRIEGTPPLNTKKAAEHAEHMHVLRVTNPGMVAPPATLVTKKIAIPTLREYGEVFLDKYGVDHKPSARNSKKQIVKAHLLPFFGHMRLDEIRQIHIDTFKAGQLERGMTPKTVNNRLGVLSTLLNYAWENVEGLEPQKLRFHVRSAETEIVAVPADEVKRLVNAAEDDRYRLAILLASEAGLRVGEIRGLQWGDVKDGQITVRRAIDTRGNVGTPKHDKRRTIPLSASLAKALADAPHRGLHVVPRLDGGVLGYCAMREALHDVYDAAEVESPEMPWHCLRHTFGTELAARGVPLPVIRDLMGHADVKTTMRYVTVADSQKCDAIDLAFRR